jgi:hypothetical protein
LNWHVFAALADTNVETFSSHRFPSVRSVYWARSLKAELAFLSTDLLKLPGKKKVKAAKNAKNNVDKSALDDAVVDFRKPMFGEPQVRRTISF